jgi:hypothetical protein
MAARAAVGIAAGVVALVALAATARAADDPWQKGAEWTSFRAGFTRSLAGGAPNGAVGAGFGYSRFVSDRLSAGVFVSYDLLGRYGSAAQIEVPMTAEYAWHFKWKTPIHPFVGVGVGAFYHKVYRTGFDRSHFQPGTLFKFGGDTPLDRHGILGAEARLASVASDDVTVDPVFGHDHPHSLRWSLKMVYSRAF